MWRRKVIITRCALLECDILSFSDEDGVNNLKQMMQRAEIGLLPLATRSSADAPLDPSVGAAGLGLKVGLTFLRDWPLALATARRSCTYTNPIHPLTPVSFCIRLSR
jgi:hypothetical protein